MKAVTTRDDPRSWFAEVYRGTYRQVYGYLYRRTSTDVEDLVAEVFAIAWRKHGELGEPPLPWLYRTASLVLKNHYRGNVRQLRLQHRVTNTAITHTADHADQVAHQMTAQETIDAIFAELSPADAEILQLWGWEQLEPADIALVLGISGAAARTRLSRARKRAVAAAKGRVDDTITQLFSA